jgi:hypothetical protein
VTWLKDDQELDLSEGAENRLVASNDGRIYRLEAKESQMNDAGTYTIQVEDKKQSCQVMITGRTLLIYEAICRMVLLSLQRHRLKSLFH